MEGLKISYIVPVYNAAKFLPLCIDSIERQGIGSEKFEVIVINDGSTDNSLEVAQRLSHRYKNVNVISVTNRGVGAARNKGISVARGKYIVFIDSDDCLEDDSILHVVNIAEKYGSEITLYKTMRHREDGIKVVWTPFLKSNEVVSGKNAIVKGLRISVIWNALYLRTFLINSKIRFIEGLTSGEDVDFGMRLYPKAKKIIQSDILVYHYFSREGSLMNSHGSENTKKKIKSNLRVARSLINYTTDECQDPSICNIYRKIANSLLVSILLDLFCSRNSYGKAFMKEIISYAIKHNVLPIVGRTESWRSNIAKIIINAFVALGKKFRFIRLLFFRKGAEDAME